MAFNLLNSCIYIILKTGSWKFKQWLFRLRLILLEIKYIFERWIILRGLWVAGKVRWLNYFSRSLPFFLPFFYRSFRFFFLILTCGIFIILNGNMIVLSLFYWRQFRFHCTPQICSRFSFLLRIVIEDCSNFLWTHWVIFYNWSIVIKIGVAGRGGITKHWFQIFTYSLLIVMLFVISNVIDSVKKIICGVLITMVCNNATIDLFHFMIQSRSQRIKTTNKYFRCWSSYIYSKRL